ncbi:MAG TPA: VWA domain-containing protein [Sandaracinaceae bacterium LLY-WYZ-13_1]|nr:VWA domain-containing protein [Sandaracinaceae bacterium LLY-WYZ-13_1]
MRFGTSARRRLSMAVGAVAVAFGAVVLARAHGAARAPEPPNDDRAAVAHRRGPTRIDVDTPELRGFVALTQAAVLAHGTREVFGEVRLEALRTAGVAERRPVALAVALDVSGSMIGDKIRQARRAVAQLAERMHPGDRLAIVAYSHEARAVVPLVPIEDARHGLPDRLDGLAAGGGTHIPGGLSLAAAQLEGAPSGMVRRLVLVSDGQDGSGIVHSDVSRAVSGRARGGTTTSALGVGLDYDERWLTSVADAGRGNYEFLAGGGELTRFLGRELEQASTTVADRTELTLELPAGWRIAEAWGARVSPGRARVPLGALFAGERRRVTLRMEVDAGAASRLHEATARLRYRAVGDETDRNLALGRLSLSVVDDGGAVADSRDVTLHAEAVAQHLDARQAEAVEAWRAGRRADAERLARENLRELERWRAAAPEAEALEARIGAASADLDNFQQHSADSAAGRAWGLESNARRRRRAVAY